MSAAAGPTDGTAPLTLTFPPELLDALAERLAPRVAELMRETAEGKSGDGWLTSDQAADYLGITRTALHKLTSAREVPFEQSGAGGRLYFQRSELDRWRRGESSRN